MDLILGIFLNKILVIVIDAVAFLLAVIVFSDNPKGKVNRLYILMTATMMLWVNFAYIPRILLDNYHDLGLLFLKIAWFATPLFFYFLYCMALCIVYKEKKGLLLNKFILLVVVFLSFAAGFTNYVVRDIERIDGIFNIIYGPFIYIFIIGSFFVAIATLVPVIRGYTAHKKNVQYFLAGLVIFYINNAIFNLVLPVFSHNARFYFFGDYSTLILLAFTSYAILKHGLFNVKVIATELLVFAIWIAVLIEFLMENTLKGRLFTGAIFIFVVVAGIFLIRSVKKEVAQREELEKLSHELQHANEELRQLDKAKSEFISIASHQLRTPLSITKGYVSMILEGIYGDIGGKIKDILQKVFIVNEGLIDLVNNLLDLSRMEAGTLKYEFKESDLVKMIDEIVMELELEAKHRNLSLTWQRPKEAMPMISADTIKLKQVIEILIENSLKYTPNGGVYVSLVKENNSLLFKVKDTGIGLDPKELDHLFNKFGRGVAGSKINAGGVGLGLYTAKQIVLAHKGDIWVESEGIGKGSTFCVRLPMA